MNWKEINAMYIKEGELLIDSYLVGEWWRELEKMNIKKEGHPYIYPDSFFRWTSLLKTIFHCPYRQLEGFVKSLSKYIPIPNVPNYKTIERRIKKLGLNVVKCFANHDKNTIIAIDSSGIKVSNRSDWIRHKWKIRRGWLKLHVAVNIKTHEVISANITTEETGDAIIAENMLKEICYKSSFKKLLADGAYDKSSIFEILKKNKIEPAIKIRKGANPKRGNKLRKQEVRMKLNLSEDEWKKTKSYGDRWNVEIWFSAYKRRFGEQISSKSWNGIFNEILTNVLTLNWLYQMRI
ncbi:MAG: IS5 family transposase [Candidatus Aenigmatarchaeota archaeon]